MSTQKLISFVLPVYNGRSTVRLLRDALQEAMEPLLGRYSLEFIWIEDGSQDSSWEELRQLHAEDRRCVVLRFSRNFGHQMALTAGIDRAHGDAVIIMDTDMQDPAEVCPLLVEQWELGYDVVYAQRRTREDPRMKRLSSHLFYRLLDRLADIQIPKDTGEFRLIDTRVAAEIRAMRERNRFLRGMVSWVGFRQTAVLFDRDERHSGESGYTLRKLLQLAFDGITGFSTMPLRVITQVGFATSALAFCGIVYALVLKLFFPWVTVPGWTLTLISILFIGGIQLITLGVVGLYIGRIYSEIQNRPLYVVSSVLDAGSDTATSAHEPPQSEFAGVRR